MSQNNTERRAVKVYGIVQGVGFRPFIYQMAQRLGLAGWVRNTSAGVEIEAEGAPERLDAFEAAITDEAPTAARVERVTSEPMPLQGEADFSIRQSQPRPGRYQLISPDLASCAECQREIFDPQNRRYRYPFTNCTNCGPRFTIIKDIPYDRPLTTMSRFTMCPDCRGEYEDPANRRFHAQPNACPVCGPRLELTDNKGNAVEGDPLAVAAALLQQGKILAVKGLGGFLLACDATNNGAVSLLRERKRRPDKPFAVMLRDLDQAGEYCYVSPEEEALLVSPASPIVLLKIRPGKALAPGVAPKLRQLGVMLPYTPLHHLLMQDTGLPLVMTSGNLSEEPIATGNEEALARLGGIADYFLMHNRDIFVGYDDSVVMVAGGEMRLVRRARGYAPNPIPLGFSAPQMQACGAELKSAFCLTRDNYAFLSQHIGDLENAETLEHYEELIEVYKRLFRITPEVLACDLHPDYLSTRYAREQVEKYNLKLVQAQHHHAHIASLLAETGEAGPVIGIALDGTGLGSDGFIWGGEVMLADLMGFRRLAHLEYLPLPGGDAATKKPYRIAVAYLYTLLGQEGLEAARRILNPDPEELELIRAQLDRRINSPLTSSAGRLFDAVSALLGVCPETSYEAQAAIELEMAAGDIAPDDERIYPFEIDAQDGMGVIRLAPLFRAILADMKAKVSAGIIAARFHYSLADMIAEVALKKSCETGVNTAGISGGCFQNRLLLELTVQALRARGLKVLSHRQVPCNDGCIALGQAAIAAHALL
jgi:hydrogenase maturation protein HypF